jgi:hypothetical protein
MKNKEFYIELGIISIVILIAFLLIILPAIHADNIVGSNYKNVTVITYVNITNSIKLHIETGKIHIYALAVSKEVLVEGEYKSVNSRELTLCQNAVKKYFNFSTAKYRNFIVDPSMLSGVNINGEKFVLA